jgi:hypothetical protein
MIQELAHQCDVWNILSDKTLNIRFKFSCTYYQDFLQVLVDNVLQYLDLIN